MEPNNINVLAEKIFKEIEKLIPVYMKNPEDNRIADGNCAVCMIDEDGVVYGKMFGAYKPRQRQSFKVAWTKASQVWLTGYRTGEYEKMVFNNLVEENANGIEAPDLIGWVGGQPLTLKNGTKLSVGFSGFRGFVDIEIVIKALEKAEG
ncbi:MAG TPA: hypothetical protein VGN20_06205 [Mucilaginibacter sp.]|jgi:glc operon protein GlcG